MQKFIFILVSYCLLSFPAFAVSELNDSTPTQFNNHIGQGKWTVLEIWSYDCPACRKTMHHLSDFYAIAEDYNARVIGVSLDGEQKRKDAQAFVKNQALEFTNLLANVQEVEQFIHQYAPQAPLGTPTVMLFSPEAEFAGIIVGPVTMNELSNYFDKQKEAEQVNITEEVL
jgi:peroxiredoxin